MLNADAKEALDQAKPQEEVSLVVFLHPDVDMNQLRRVKDVDQRMQQLGRIYSNAKQPILDQVSAYADAGLRVVDTSEGAPHLLLFGPAKAWRQMFRKHASVFGGPKVEVSANNIVGTAI